jgi:hypothetical protein
MDGLRGEGGLGQGAWFHSSCLDNEERFDEKEAAGLAEEMSDMRWVLS